jgi:endonuclease G
LQAKLGVTFQTGLGRPTDAAVDASRRTDYLIERSQFVLSYNDDTRQANWVGWSLSNADRGSTDRTDAWSVETLLPSGYLRVGTATFGTGWDRGHMAPSADRTLTYADNAATFVMSNIIPQASRNNQGLWGDFENYSRLTLAADGSEVLIISGPSEFGGTMLSNGMAIPKSVWKIAVKVPAGSGSAAQRVTQNSRVIALLTPNQNLDNLGSWQGYITSVEEIEALTGFKFFRDIEAVNPALATYLKNVVDTGTGPNSPTVITSFSPTSGSPGSAVTISGYNFGTSATVRFNGVNATAATVLNGTQISTTVPANASTGEITVVCANGTDTSAAKFTVLGSSSPTISLSTSVLAGLTATAGSPGISKTYALSGSTLSSPVTLSAPAGLELSLNNTVFAQSVSVSPVGGAIVNVPVYVRLSASLQAGPFVAQVAHTSTNATAVNLSVSGEVVSSTPTISLSTSSLAGFTAATGQNGIAKSYTLSGRNLAGNLTIAASAGFEVSVDGTNYFPAFELVNSGSTLAATTIFARIASSAPQGPLGGNITHSGGGAQSKTLAVSGVAGSGGSNSTAEVFWSLETASPLPNQTINLTVGDISRGNHNGNASSSMFVTLANMGNYTGASGGSHVGAAARIGALNTSGNGSVYFEFTITPEPGVNFELRGISFGSRSSGTGPQGYALRSSKDNYSTNIIQGITSNNSVWVLNELGISGFGSNSSTTFRIYGFNGVGNAGAGTVNWRIDDLKLNLASSSPPVSTIPSITSTTLLSAPAFDSFSYQITATNTPTSFAASGLPAGLSCNPATGLISGTPTVPGIYSATLTASNASGDGTASISITVSQNSNAPLITGNLSAAGQVREPFEFQPTTSNPPKAWLASNLPAGLDIDSTTGLITGTPTAAGNFTVWLTVQNDFGSDSKTLLLAIKNPSLALSMPELTGFSSTLGSASTSRSYTVSGTELSGDITVLAPPNFEISSGSAFSSNVVLQPANGSFSANLSVRLSANATLGTHEGSIIHSGGGAVPKYLAVSGNVTAPVPTLSLSATALEPFSTTTNTTSNFQTYTVAGGGLTGNVSIQAPAGFEIRKEGGDEFANSLSLAPENGTITQTTIEVRLAASLTGGNPSGFISHGSPGITVKQVSVSGTVIVVEPPTISTSGSGSAYLGRAHSLTIRVEGSTPVIGYGATGLPQGMAVNTSTGLISGTPSVAGIFPLILSASGNGGTATANYTLAVRAQNSDPALPDVAVNKFLNNGTADTVELLVTAQGIRGATVDLRGMVLKDFSSNAGADLGGKFLFSNSSVWQSVKAGTLIVLSSTNATQDLDGSDFILRANLSNQSLFSAASGGFDITNTDMVMIKEASAGADGLAGGIHALSAGSVGSQFSNFNGSKLNASRNLSSSRPLAFAVNDSSSINDFKTSSGADTSREFAFGSGNNGNNTTFIAFLRTSANTPPVITLNGTNPMTIAHGTVYNEPGATANDAEDGSRPVTISGNVSASVGNYTITYTASDSGNLTTTVNRTVLVRDQTPPVVTLNGNATIEIPFGGNFTDPGATANDAVDGNRTVNVSGSVNRFAAGPYILNYTATDTAGNTSPGVTRTVVVAKGVPEISQPPSATPITTGSELSASALSGGSASVSGNFSWTNPSTIPPLGSGNFSVTFTPADTGNYTLATTFALLTVNPAATAFESWTESQGLSGPDAAMTADPDSDGFDNVKEFAFGLDPKSAGAQPLEISRDDQGRVKVTFLKRSGISYTIRISSDLAIGFTGTLPTSPSADESNLPEGYTRHEALLPDQDKAFIKIEAAIE